MTIPPKFALLHYGKEIVMLADCILDHYELSHSFNTWPLYMYGVTPVKNFP